MHITVLCPSCHSRYHLQPNMRGLKMRCNNPVCREVFEVRDEAEAPPPKDDGNQGPGPDEGGPPNGASGSNRSPESTPVGGRVVHKTGSVGDMIPILSAEAAEEAPAADEHPPAEESPEEATPLSLPSPGTASKDPTRVQDVVPFLPAEVAYPVEPEAFPEPSTSSPATGDAPTYGFQEPASPAPAARAKAAEENVDASASPASTRPPEQGSTFDWRTAPPPPRQGSQGPSTPPDSRSRPPEKLKPQRLARAPVKRSQPKTINVAKAPAEGAEARTTDRNRETMQAEPGGPVELPPGAWDAPPVRQGGTEPSTLAGLNQEPEAAGITVPVDGSHPADLPSEVPAAPDVPLPPPRRRGRRVVIAICALLLLAAVGLGLAFILRPPDEPGRYQQALGKFEAGNYTAATKDFRALAKDYPTPDQSEHATEYDFMAGLSEALAQCTNPQADPVAAFDQLDGWVAQHGDKKQDRDWVKARAGVIWSDGYRRVISDLSALAEEKHDRALLEKARKVLNSKSKPFWPEDRMAEVTELKDNLNRIELAIGKWERRESIIAELKGLIENPTEQGADDMRRKVKGEGLDQDADVKGLLAQLDDALRGRKVFAAAGTRPPPGSAYVAGRTAATAEDENGLSYLVVPPVVGSAPNGPITDQVAFTQSQGVLCALNQATGEPQWATRVGIDMRTLPVRARVPGTARELVLVLSSLPAPAGGKPGGSRYITDLAARDARNGKVIWRHRLTAPSLGRPLLVENRVYVGTLDGLVHEIQLSDGMLMGWFDLGQPLPYGGVHQKGTSLLYFPGDQRSIYVLDVDPARRARQALNPKDPNFLPSCVAILQSGHPAGSLRGEPIIAYRSGRGAPAGGPVPFPDLLILNQTDGLDGMRLRVFALPVQNPDGPPLMRAELEPRLEGWSWFRPYHDTEKVAQVTDAGKLGVFGIDQYGNQDRPLFTIVQENVAAGEAVHPGRAQVVHSAEDNLFWVLGNGQLKLWHFDPFGAKAASLWEQGLPLGFPLHDAQVDDDGRTLFVVSQATGRPTSLATAVEAYEGKVRWQRQLGFLCRGEPLVLEDKVLAADKGGALFAFDPKQKPKALNGPWRVAEQMLGGPLEGVVSGPYLIAGADGNLAYEVAGVDRGEDTKDRYQIVVRRFDAVTGAVAEKAFPGGPLAGRPAARADGLLLPLQGGEVRRQPFEGAGSNGPTWKDRNADEGAAGYVLPLGTDDLLTTDGRRGLQRWHWPPGDPVFRRSDEKKTAEEKDATLPARIVSAPVLVPRDQAAPLVGVADADGNVSLLVSDNLGQVVRRWKLDGKITAGPFVRGSRIGCVVDERRLVWLDPAADRPAWEYSSSRATWSNFLARLSPPGAWCARLAAAATGRGEQTLNHPIGDEIVGRPQLVGDTLYVADESGRYVGLDPASGAPRAGATYTLNSGAAPAAAPVAFGPDRAFAPLTDGTVFLLPLAKEKAPDSRAASGAR